MSASSASPLPSSEISLSATGVSPDKLTEFIQTTAAEFGFNFTFAAGSSMILHITMAEQSSTQKVRTGDIKDANIGVIGSARDVSAHQTQVQDSTLGPDEKKALQQAWQTLESLNLNRKTKDDVAGDLGKVAEELKDSEPDEGRLKRLLRNIKELAPPVASVLSMASSLHKLMT